MKTLKRFKEPAGNPRKLKKKLKKTLEKLRSFPGCNLFPQRWIYSGGSCTLSLQLHAGVILLSADKLKCQHVGGNLSPTILAIDSLCYSRIMILEQKMVVWCCLHVFLGVGRVGLGTDMVLLCRGTEEVLHNDEGWVLSTVWDQVSAI